MTHRRTKVYVPAPLPLTVAPIPGETAISFMSRFADENGISLNKINHVVAGKIRAKVGGWTDDQWDRLTIISGQRADRLEGMRHRPAPIPSSPGAVTFLSHPVKSMFLLRDTLRICPSCIGERRMLRQTWTLVHSVACSVHECLLVDQCDCGRPFHVSSRGDDAFTCICGKPFEDLSARPASAHALAGTRWMHTHLPWWAVRDRITFSRDDHLPDPFRSMPFGDVLALIHVVGRVASTPAADDEKMEGKGHIGHPSGEVRGFTDLATSLGIVEAAMAVVAGWPHSYDELLAEVSGRNPATRPLRRQDLFRTRMGHLLAIPPNGLDRHPIPCLKESVDRFCEENGIAARRRVPVRRSSTARRLAKTANISTVAEMLGTNGKAELFYRLYNEVAASLDGIDCDEDTLQERFLEEMKRRWTGSEELMSSCEASRHLDHPAQKHTMLGWTDAGLLTPVDGSLNIDPRRSTEQFDAGDVRALRARLGAVAKVVSRVPAAYGPYATVSKQNVGMAYHKSDLLLDIMNGVVPVVTKVAQPRLTDLHVDRETARRRSAAKRIRRTIMTDSFGTTNQAKMLLGELWPDRGEHLTVELNRNLRMTKAVRFTDVRNTTEGRDRPLYHYSIVDHLVRGRRKFGPSTVPEIDVVLDDLARSRGRGSAGPHANRRNGQSHVEACLAD